MTYETETGNLPHLILVIIVMLLDWYYLVYKHCNQFSLFRLFRHIAYRQFVRWIWRRLGKHVRMVIPSCAVSKIRSQFPSESYKGFKLPGIDH